MRATSIDLHVAARLRIARLEAGLAQEQAADVIGLTFQQIQKYESGKNRITAGKLFQLAELYGKPLPWFFEGATASKLAPRRPHSRLRK